jgi:hypothetical protein
MSTVLSPRRSFLTLFLACVVVLAHAAEVVRAGEVRRVDLDHGHCLVAVPSNLPDGERAPLIICLHGTMTKAEDILEFWQSIETELPYVMIAPQGVDAGWRETDLPFLREMSDELIPSLPVDGERVLLTGHSAGGAMAMHLLYAESFPCTAVAVSANYVPPTVTPEQVGKRSDIPVFYSVGQSDINRGPMLEGLELLRQNDVRVTVSRPPIGHVLSREVGQEAMRWFEAKCREDVEAHLKNVPGGPGDQEPVRPAAGALERLLAHRHTHFPDQVKRAEALLERLLESGRRQIARAKAKWEEGEPLPARDLLLEVEREYRASSLQDKARALRFEIEADPGVAALLEQQAVAEAEARAEELWRQTTEAMEARDWTACRQHCTTLVTLYPETKRAGEARELLKAMNRLDGRR